MYKIVILVYLSLIPEPQSSMWPLLTSRHDDATPSSRVRSLGLLLWLYLLSHSLTFTFLSSSRPLGTNYITQEASLKLSSCIRGQISVLVSSRAFWNKLSERSCTDPLNLSLSFSSTTFVQLCHEMFVFDDDCWRTMFFHQFSDVKRRRESSCHTAELYLMMAEWSRLSDIRANETYSSPLKFDIFLFDIFRIPHWKHWKKIHLL